jgi:hypothetical protein
MVFLKTILERCEEWSKHIYPPLPSRHSNMSWMFHASEGPIVTGQITNLLPKLEVYVCFKKLKQLMHEALIHIQYTNAYAIYI